MPWLRPKDGCLVHHPATRGNLALYYKLPHNRYLTYFRRTYSHRPDYANVLPKDAGGPVSKIKNSRIIKTVTSWKNDQSRASRPIDMKKMLRPYLWEGITGLSILMGSAITIEALIRSSSASYEDLEIPHATHAQIMARSHQLAYIYGLGWGILTTLFVATAFILSWTWQSHISQWITERLKEVSVITAAPAAAAITYSSAPIGGESEYTATTGTQIGITFIIIGWLLAARRIVRRRAGSALQRRFDEALEDLTEIRMRAASLESEVVHIKRLALRDLERAERLAESLNKATETLAELYEQIERSDSAVRKAQQNEPEHKVATTTEEANS